LEVVAVTATVLGAPQYNMKHHLFRLLKFINLEISIPKKCSDQSTALDPIKENNQRIK